MSYGQKHTRWPPLSPPLRLHLAGVAAEFTTAGDRVTIDAASGENWGVAVTA